MRGDQVLKAVVSTGRNTYVNHDYPDNLDNNHGISALLNFSVRRTKNPTCSIEGLARCTA